ncbi:PAS domain-containing protein [Kineococcus sp. NBC_00420]|uniref:PAS domain-containing protein n=1 Tax=Kineococcus sp. NBC_00420 TaxID=2903564 RepID=UPI002E241F3B
MNASPSETSAEPSKEGAVDSGIDREHRLHLRAEKVADLIEALWGDSPPLGPDPKLSTFIDALGGDDEHGRQDHTVVHGDGLTYRQLVAALLDSGSRAQALAHLPAPLLERLLAAGALTVAPVSIGMAALPAAHTGAWDFDAVTGLVSFDAEAARLMGLTHHGGQGTLDMARADHVHPDDRALVAAALDEALRTGRRYETRFRCAMPDGTYAWRASRARALNPVESAATTSGYGGPDRRARVRYRPQLSGVHPSTDTTASEGIRWTRLIGFIAADE